MENMENTVIYIDPYYTIDYGTTANNQKKDQSAYLEQDNSQSQVLVQSVKTFFKWAIETCNKYNIRRHNIDIESPTGDLNV